MLMMKGEIAYSVVRSTKRKRTMCLQVMPDGRVVMRVPYRTPQEEIDRFFRTKSGWVKKQLSEREGHTDKPRFLPGERFLYLGERYPLEIEGGNGNKAPLVLKWSRFILDGERAGEARALFTQWYKEEARRLIPERVSRYSKRLGLFPTGVKVTSARFRYGSCSPENSLSFSWKLIMAPLSVIDYIIVHELMHIKEKSHSKKYWGLVASAMPDYRTHKLWLKTNNHLLGI